MWGSGSPKQPLFTLSRKDVTKSHAAFCSVPAQICPDKGKKVPLNLKMLLRDSVVPVKLRGRRAKCKTLTEVLQALPWICPNGIVHSTQLHTREDGFHLF